MLLVLEDLHWADTSTQDLVVFLAHHLGDRRVLLLGTCRADEPTSAARVRRLGHARELLATARHAAAEAAAVTPNAAGWLALAEAEHQRAHGAARPAAWSAAAATWDRLKRPPLAAYCHWRQAEALVTAGASRAQASEPLAQAHAVATRIGATPLLRELELLAQRARLELAPPQPAAPDGREAWRRPSA